MNISKNGIDLIHSFEGCRLKAYKALATEQYYTIGWGHYGADVSKDMIITQKQADDLFLQDISKYEARVNKYNSTYKWTQNEFDALVSFAYNIGSIDQLTDNGRRSKSIIAQKILLYTKSGGAVIPGLVTRRKKERDLFVSLAPSTNKSRIYAAPYTLRINCKNADVGLLQKQLNQVMNAGLVVDNKYGRLTKQAVLDFQKRFFKDEREHDGVYGPKTKQKLEELLNA